MKSEYIINVIFTAALAYETGRTITDDSDLMQEQSEGFNAVMSIIQCLGLVLEYNEWKEQHIIRR